MINKRELGTEYETLACEYLEKEGMKIIARNYRVRIGEIDIIAMDGDELVFIEVKYRKDRSYGGAEYAISPAKQKVIRRVADWYIKQHRINPNSFFRFDAVLIDGADIEHIKNAWR